MQRVLRNVPNVVSVLSLTAVLVLGIAGSAYAAPATSKTGKTPPASSLVSGPQDKPAIEPGARDAQLTEKLGPTDLAKTDANGQLRTATGDVTARAGTIANVNFLAPLNYCSRNLAYTPVQNTSTTNKSIQVRVYNQSGYRDIYTSVAPNATVYPAFYGISGTYTAYLYVWNGSTYQYDEYRSSTHTCRVSVDRVYASGGWVQLKIQNTGTAYATQQSSEIAPYPASGTYTGTHYDYPAAGGAAIYRWFYVGTSPYGIVSHTLGSSNSPYLFSGDL